MPGFAVDTHPEKNKIIELIMAGTPLRTIGAMVNPPLPHTSIQSYKIRVIRPMMARADQTSRLLSGHPLLSTNVVVDPKAPADVQAVQQAIIDRPAVSIFRKRLEKLYGQLDHTMERAQTSVRCVTDQETGELVAVGADLGVIAPIANQMHKGLEMLGRATGELEPIGGNAISIQILTPASQNELPRVSFAAADQIELPPAEDYIEEIGVKQIG